MIVPGAPREGANIVPINPPSYADMLMAAAVMHQQGRFAEQTQSGGSDPEAFVRALKRDRQPPRGNVDRVLNPGERVPDPERGGLAARDVRGT